MERARILLAYAGGPTVSAIAHDLGTNQPRVERCADKGLQVGPLVLLGNLPWPGQAATLRLFLGRPTADSRFNRRAADPLPRHLPGPTGYYLPPSGTGRKSAAYVCEGLAGDRFSLLAGIEDSRGRERTLDHGISVICYGTGWESWHY